MAHTVPDEGDTVEVLMENETVEGTVVAARGNYAEVDTGDKTVDAHHESVATDSQTAYRQVAESTDSEAAEADEESVEEPVETTEVEPSNLTVSLLETAIEGIDDVEELETVLAKEQAGKDRTTAVEAIEDRLEDLS